MNRTSPLLSRSHFYQDECWSPAKNDASEYQAWDRKLNECENFSSRHESWYSPCDDDNDLDREEQESVLEDKIALTYDLLANASAELGDDPTDQGLIDRKTQLFAELRELQNLEATRIRGELRKRSLISDDECVSRLNRAGAIIDKYESLAASIASA